MIFRKKCTSQFFPSCNKCFVSIKTVCDVYCDKCHSINYAYLMLSKDLDEIRDYIWHNSIEEKGLEWYKTARDKLIVVIEKRESKRLKREQKATNKLLKKHGFEK